MPAANRIYVVKQSEGETAKERLVRAPTAAQAIRHCVKPMFTADVATQDDLVRLAKTCDVEEATE